MTRRDLILTAAAAIPASGATAIPADVVRRHDESVEWFLQRQITDPANQRMGAVPDGAGLYPAALAAALLANLGTAFLHDGSRYYGQTEIMLRMRMAASFLERSLSTDGNIDLLETNFNSAPDTGFMVHGLAPLLRLARERRSDEVGAMVQPLLERCGHGLATGGVHTPNHRWVVCSALAQIHECIPKPEYVRRIDQWLAEGIDIDADGQFTERSTSVYDPVCDRALVVIADKLKRPDLLEPVRRNLDSLLYLLHPNLEVVTEISRRQDQYQSGYMWNYWFPLQYMAVRDGNGQYALLAAEAAKHNSSLPVLLEYPQLLQPVAAGTLPSNFEKHFPSLGITRIRRGNVSATLVLGGSSRFFTLRRGDANVAAIRFASAFFGKGQFIPQKAVKQGDAFVFTQELRAGYYQPLEPAHRVAAGEWGSVRSERKESEVCRLSQSATVREEKDGFTVRIQASGTKGVPLTIEVALGAGASLEGCEAVTGVAGGFLVKGNEAVCRAAADTLSFGPNLREHRYVSVRGAEPRIPGLQSVYLTALTPVDHILRFGW